MLDQLTKLIRDNAGDLIVNNRDVPDNHNEDAINETGSVIQNVLGSALQGGNLSDLLGLFGNRGAMQSNPLVGSIVSQLASSLGSKFGVGESQAQQISSSLVPQVMDRFAQKTNDPDDDAFNINDIMGNLSGGKAGGVDFGSLVSQLQEGKNVDLGGITENLFGGGKSGGGIGDLLGGFFKK